MIGEVGVERLAAERHVQRTQPFTGLTAQVDPREGRAAVAGRSAVRGSAWLRFEWGDRGSGCRGVFRRGPCRDGGRGRSFSPWRRRFRCSSGSRVGWWTGKRIRSGSVRGRVVSAWFRPVALAADAEPALGGGRSGVDNSQISQVRRDRPQVVLAGAVASLASDREVGGRRSRMIEHRPGVGSVAGQAGVDAVEAADRLADKSWRPAASGVGRSSGPSPRPVRRSAGGEPQSRHEATFPDARRARQRRSRPRAIRGREVRRITGGRAGAFSDA